MQNNETKEGIVEKNPRPAPTPNPKGFLGTQCAQCGLLMQTDSEIKAHIPCPRFPRDQREKITPLPTGAKVNISIDTGDLKAKADYHMIRNALVGLVGEDDPYELGGMQETIKVMDMPENERTKTLEAIHALLETQPRIPRVLK